jgi:4-oxalocrotonate tautomerase
MPAIRVDLSAATKEKKAELVAQLTKTAAEVLGISESAFSVYIAEYGADNIGVGGTLLSDRKK